MVTTTKTQLPGMLLALAILSGACVPAAQTASPIPTVPVTPSSEATAAIATPSAVAVTPTPVPSPSPSPTPVPPTAELGAVAAAARGGIVKVIDRVGGVDIIAAGAYLGGSIVIAYGAFGRSPSVEIDGARLPATVVGEDPPSYGSLRGSSPYGPGPFTGFAYLLVAGLDRTGVKAPVLGELSTLRPDDVFVGLGYVEGRLAAGALVVRSLAPEGQPGTRLEASPALYTSDPTRPNVVRPASGPLYDRSGALVGLASAFGPSTALGLYEPIGRTLGQIKDQLAAAPEVRNFLLPLTTSWRPEGTTALIGEQGRVDAISLLSGRRTSLIRLGAGVVESAWRSDGRLLAATVATQWGTSRIALWDARTGEVRWLTPEAPRLFRYRPVWATDGAHLFYGEQAYEPDPAGSSVWRLDVSSGQADRVFSSNAPYVKPIFAPTAGSLVIDRSGEYRPLQGGAPRLLDLSTGQAGPEPDGPIEITSWRQAAPHALGRIHVTCFFECIGDQTLGLLVWDGLGAGSTTLLGGSIENAGAAWDPAGERLVFAAHRPGSKDRDALEIMTATGEARTQLGGTEDGYDPRWLREGILYTWAAVTAWDTSPWGGNEYFYPRRDLPVELRIVTPGLAPRTVFRSDSWFSLVDVVGAP